MERLAREIDRVVAAGDIPSVSVCVWVDGVERFHRTAGVARRPDRAARPDEPYDLASVTKVLATVPVVAELLDRGALDLDAPVAEILPDVDPRITARHLLSHASGLPAWAPLYETCGRWGTAACRRAILDAARATAPVHPPGTVHVYSDLGYLVLCDLVETVGGARLDRLLQPILDRLGERDLRWGWPGAAATRDDPLRGGVVEGAVDDMNCYAMGGVSTHAGLFGTARAVARTADALRQAMAGERDDLPASALRAMAGWRGPGSHRLGFDGISAGYTSTGGRFPPDTVGHLGYTGTSVWIVPSRRAAVAVLTNRIHPVDDLAAIRAARPALHDAVAADLGW